MKKNKKKESLDLCFKYATNCKLCPRYKKCNDEIEKERKSKKVGWCNGNILVSVAKDKSSTLLPTTK